MLDLLPEKLPDEARYRLPPVVPAIGERRYRVALLTGCIGSVLFARTNWRLRGSSPTTAVKS